MAEQDLYKIKIENIDEKQIPELIQSHLEVMRGLRKEIDMATSKALDAKEAVINEVGPRTTSKKQAIDNLQAATMSLADAQAAAMSAQEMQFEYQQKLSDITKFLLRLGLTNIAMNRVVVEELEYRLRNASQEELDDLARAEIENLLKRLKMQQDVDKKQSELTKLLKEQADINDAQVKEIYAQAKKDEEHDKRIDELYSIIAKQDQIIGKMLLEMDEMRKDLFKLDEEFRYTRTKNNLG